MKAKLAQMAERVFEIKEGSVEEKARACIQRIDDFYSKVMGVPTHISEYPQYSQDKAWIEEVHKKFVAQNVHFGEDGDIDADVACEIIRNSY